VDTVFERWCECRSGYRVLCWFLSIVLVVGIAWGVLLRPINTQLAGLQREIAHATRTNASLWPSARRLPGQVITPDERVVTPFSPLDFQGNGSRLVHWKPLQRGGELALDADWQAVPSVFSMLLERDVLITAFSLTPQGTTLRLRVQLEHEYAK
jgi:pilus assembly protein HofO